jgi:hypothetical protein
MVLAFLATINGLLTLKLLINGLFDPKTIYNLEMEKEYLF